MITLFGILIILLGIVTLVTKPLLIFPRLFFEEKQCLPPLSIEVNW